MGIMIGVNDYEFKNGAFKELCKESIPVAKTLNILLGSGLTSPQEKKNN
jgi:hypothetical protein